MKILYLFTRDRDATTEALVEGQKEQHQVTVLDLRTEKDFKKIVQKIEKAERIISW